MENGNEKENSNLDKVANWLESNLIWILIVGIILTLIGPWLFTRTIPYIPSFGGEGEIGDTLGGITAPIIGLITILLIFLTYQSQKKELKETRDTAKKQAEIMAQQQFENTFFELLKVHRENVAQIRYGNNEFGRKAFIRFKQEYLTVLQFLDLRNGEPTEKLRGIEEALNFPATKNPVQTYVLTSLNLKEHEKLIVGYLIFYYGVGPNSDKILSNAIHHEKINLTDQQIQIIINFFRTLQEYRKTVKKRQNYGEGFLLNNGDFKYEGQQSNLSHYFRHLFQTVKYVENHSYFELFEAFKKEDLKRFYVKQLRSQLSAFELTIFFANSLTALGNEWEWLYKDNKCEDPRYYITKYELIRNLPDYTISFQNTERKSYRINHKKYYPGIYYEDEEPEEFKTRISEFENEANPINLLSIAKSPRKGKAKENKLT